MYGVSIKVARDHYWENFYHYRHDNGTKHDMVLTALQSFSRIGAHQEEDKECQFLPIWRPMKGTLLQVNDSFNGVLTHQQFKIIADQTERDSVTVETFFQPIPFMELLNTNLTEPGNRLKSLQVRIFFGDDFFVVIKNNLVLLKPIFQFFLF